MVRVPCTAACVSASPLRYGCENRDLASAMASCRARFQLIVTPGDTLRPLVDKILGSPAAITRITDAIQYARGWDGHSFGSFGPFSHVRVAGVQKPRGHRACMCELHWSRGKACGRAWSSVRWGRVLHVAVQTSLCHVFSSRQVHWRAGVTALAWYQEW